MSTTVDVLVTEYRLNAHQYSQGAKQVTGATAGLEAQAAKSAKAMTGFHLAAMGVATGLAALATVGVVSFQKFAEFESLQKALAAVEGSASDAEDAIKSLREIAKAPGLGFQEAVKGYMMLRNQGVSGPGAERMVSEFGNANARAGGGKEELQRILLAVSQIAGQRFLQGDELRQLTEAGIPAARLVRERFGTSDTEQLKRQGVTSEQVLTGLLDDLERMPRVAGGAKNSIENMQDALDQAMIGIGSGIADVVVKPLTDMGDALTDLSGTGYFKELIGGITTLGTNSGTARDAVFGLAGRIKELSILADSLSKRNSEFDKFNPYRQIYGRIWNWATGADFELAKKFEGEAEMQSRYDAMKAAKKAAEEAGDPLMENKGKGGGDDAKKEPKKHTALLNRIAVANEAQLDLQRIVLGASGAKQRAFQAVELAGATRRGGRGWESKIVEAVREAAGEIAAQNVAAFQRANSPFAVGR